MMNRILRYSLSLVPVAFLACGGTAPVGTQLFEPATGALTLSPPSGTPISGFTFDNEGASEIQVADLRVKLQSGEEFDNPFSVFVEPGQTVTYTFDPSAAHLVASATCKVLGSTTVLVVGSTQVTGVVPGSSPNPSK